MRVIRAAEVDYVDPFIILGLLTGSIFNWLCIIIVVIIVIIIAIVLIARIARAKPKDTAQNEESSTDITSLYAKDRSGRMRNRSKRLGVAFVVAGILFALVGISMFRWAVQGYVWAFVAVGVGLVLLFLSRRK